MPYRRADVSARGSGFLRDDDNEDLAGKGMPDGDLLAIFLKNDRTSGEPLDATDALPLVDPEADKLRHDRTSRDPGDSEPLPG
jgi:hypothetical protein